MKTMNPRVMWGATLFAAPGTKSSGGGFAAMLSLVILLALVLVPFVLFCRSSKPGPPDLDAGDGWGKPPEPPPDLPRGPQGGVPLDDAVQAGARLRGKGRLADMRTARSRRPAREPERRPVRVVR